MLSNFALIIFFTLFMTLSCYIVMFCIKGRTTFIAHELSGKSEFPQIWFWQPAKSARFRN